MQTKKAADIAKSDASTQKAKTEAEANLKQAKARSLRAYYDATAGQEALTSKINALLAEHSSLGNEYQTLIENYTKQLKGIIIAKKIEASKLEDVKKEAEALINLGDKGRRSQWTTFWQTPISKLTDKSSESTILSAIRNQFPEYDLLEKAGEQFKEDQVLRRAKALALQYGLAEPKKDDQIDAFLTNLELRKYKSPDSDLVSSISSYLSTGAPQQPINVEELVQTALSTHRAELQSRSEAKASDNSTPTEDAKMALVELEAVSAAVKKIVDAAAQVL